MRRQVGFTLIELMIVVVIIGVLAVVAGTAFRKYSDSGRAAEAMAMIGEFRTKQEAYKAEFNSYLSTTTIGEADLYPILTTGCPSGQIEPCPKTVIPNTSRPTNWNTLGINPTRTQLYCGYVTINSAANTWSGLTSGQSKLAIGGSAQTAPTTPWFYVYVECDNKKAIVKNTTFIAASNTATVVTLNEHQ